MKVVVADLCSYYDVSQRAARDPKHSSKRDRYDKLVAEKRDEISVVVDAEMGVLATGCSTKRAAEAAAELSYFASWLSRRGGWSG